MRLATANILSFGLDAGWGVISRRTEQGVGRAQEIPTTKEIRQQNPNVQFDRGTGYAFSRVPMARIDRAVALKPTGRYRHPGHRGNGQTGARKFAGSRFDRTVRVRHEGIDKEAG